ncbi:MAG: hypothetical protein ACKOAH_20570, partial [Pirellula sp.]
SRRSEVELYQALASRAIIGWSDRLFRATLTKPAFQNIRQIVRILPPLLENHLFSHEKRGFRGDSGDSQDDSPGGKAAH